MAIPALPYSPVIRAGDWVIVSGQLGVANGELVPGGVAAQTRQAIANLRTQLHKEGCGLDHVKKTLCFLTDMNDFAAFNEVYAAAFDNEQRPARSTVGVAALPFGGIVEIEAWAYAPGSVGGLAG